MKIGVTALNLVTLLGAVQAATQHLSIGYEGADLSYEKFLKALDQRLEVKKELLESAMWSAIHLHEEGLFTPPNGLSMDAWIRALTPKGHKFDKRYFLFSREQHAR